MDVLMMDWLDKLLRSPDISKEKARRELGAKYVATLYEYGEAVLTYIQHSSSGNKVSSNLDKLYDQYLTLHEKLCAEL